MSLKRRLTVLAATAASALSVVAATPASAAEPQCNNFVIKSSTARVPSLNGSTACGLGYGAKNNAVGALQRALDECYDKDIAIDNEFGRATENALRSVQSAAGNMGNPDGHYGPGTRARLQYAGYSRLEGWYCAGR